jgi:2-succinyl-6-hydroxy-2,4-cyclohexadiene-1-carboxylate synthase
VLIGASPGIEDPAERAARVVADERLADEIEGLSIAEFARRWASTPVLAGQPAEVRAFVESDRLRNEPVGLARALRGLGTGALPSVWSRLSELSMPVMLIAGERDGKFTAIASSMAALVRDAKVVVVPGVGHAVHLEDPAAVAAAIRGVAS